MRTITLLRHAKSSWDAPADAAPLADKDRPLSPRGLRDAPRMGRWMAASNIVPDLVLCSTSVRTRQTLELVLGEFSRQRPRTKELDSLYLAEAAALLQMARTLPGKIGHILFVGHDPGMQDLAMLLIGSGDRDGRSALRSKFPTAGIAVIDFDVAQWADVAGGRGQLRYFMSPKRLPA